MADVRIDRWLLYTSRRHLGNAFRKLDVRSRRELPQALGESPQA